MRLLVRRLVWAVFVVWAVTTLTFVVNVLLPEAIRRAWSRGSRRAARRWRVSRGQLGLDRPLPGTVRAIRSSHVPLRPEALQKLRTRATRPARRFLPGLHVDFGKSISHRRSVIALLGDRLPRTLALGLLAVFLQLALGVPAGVFAARAHKRPADGATMAVALLGISAPTFLIGLFVQWVFAFKLRLLPSDGFGVTFADHAACAILPALTLGVFGAAYYTRLVRDEMIEAMRHDFVRTARAKGMTELRVTLRHGLRNVLVPLSTVIGLELGALVGGALITERVFRWPGVGALLVEGLLNRDGPIITGTVIVTSTAIVIANVAADLLSAALDPRLRR